MSWSSFTEKGPESPGRSFPHPTRQPPSHTFLERGERALNQATLLLKEPFCLKSPTALRSGLPVFVFLSWLRNLSSEHQTAPSSFPPAVPQWKAEGQTGNRRSGFTRGRGHNLLLVTCSSCSEVRGLLTSLVFQRHRHHATCPGMPGSELPGGGGGRGGGLALRFGHHTHRWGSSS